MEEKEMIGKKFGRWTVLGVGPVKKNRSGHGKKTMHCRCECGTERDVYKDTLLNGKSKSCGCLHSKIMHDMFPDSDMIGKRFGRGVVQKYAYSRGRAKVWELLCDCGNTYYCDTGHLNNGHTVSCGCYHIDERTTHGGTANKERLFSIWMGIRRRCRYPKHSCYKYYGARGIEMCDEWYNDYAVFREWAYNNGYTDNLSIDRIDVNGNYCPENCRWITLTEQCRNTRYNRFEEMDGISKPVIQWLDDYGITKKKYKNAVYDRLKRGWSLKDALLASAKEQNNNC